MFRLLARMKGLRGTALDPFGYTAERKMERQLIREYETIINEIVDGLTLDNQRFATALARIPDEIRGFGPVKELSVNRAKEREAELLTQFRKPPAARKLAKEAREPAE